MTPLFFRMKKLYNQSMYSKFFFLLLCILQLCGAASPIQFDDHREGQPIGQDIEYWLDHTGQTPITNLEHGKFAPSSNSILNFGFHSGSLWIHFHTQGQSDGDWYLDLGNPHLAHSTLFYRGPSGWDSLQGGALYEPTHDLRKRNIFELRQDTGITEYYLRIQTPSALLTSLSIQSQNSLWQNNTAHAWNAGVQIGSLLLLALYNFFFLALALRSKAYFYYVLMLVSNAAYLLYDHGLGFDFFPGLPYDLQLSWGIMLGCIICAIGLQFTRSMLRLAQLAPRLDWVYLTAIALCLIPLLVYMLNNDYPMLATSISVAILSLPLLISGTTLWLILKGEKDLWVFLAAWLILGSGGSAYALTINGVLLANEWNLNAYRWGSVAEAFLLTFAMTQYFYRLIQEKERLQKAEIFLREVSEHDSLTGLYNRRHLDQILPNLIQLYKDPFSIMILDVDHFKSINDHYGHSIGDEVLRHLGALLQASLRTADVPCRYGGEEFVVILPNTELGVAKQVADRIRVQFSDLELRDANDNPFHATLSIGIAQHSPGESKESIISRADMALYWAKNISRNRVACALPAELEDR